MEASTTQSTAGAAGPPQNIEAERSVLGAMMVSEAAVLPVIEVVKLKAGDFYLDRHRLIYSCLFDLYESSSPTDELSVAEKLTQLGQLEQAGGVHYVSELSASVPSVGSAEHHARIVQDNALLRRLVSSGHTIQEWVRDRAAEPRQLAEDAERLLFEVAHEEQSSDFREIGAILDDEVNKLEKLAASDSDMTGVPSGFRALDKVTGGFQEANMIVVAARPSMGKSALIANIAENVALKNGMPVAFFSLEMSETELAQRFIASTARLSGDKLRRGQVSQRDWPKVMRACNQLSEAPLWIDDSPDLSMLDMRAKARRLHAAEHAKGGLGLVMVDYLQLMRAEDSRQSRVEQVGQISRGLKILAKELNVPVIAVSQLSRAPEQRPDKRPILSDLRESGQVEQDADVVMFLFRAEYYANAENPVAPEDEGMAEVIIAKHRNGPVGTQRLAFLSQFPKFMDAAHERPVEAPASAAPPDMVDPEAETGDAF